MRARIRESAHVTERESDREEKRSDLFNDGQQLRLYNIGR